MKKIALVTCLAALCVASVAVAQDEISASNALGLGWTGCSTTQAFGTQNQAFACATEATNACRVFRLMPTFVSTLTDPRLAGSQTYIDVLIGSGAVGGWWSGFTGVAGCRATPSMSTAGPITAGTTVCQSIYPGTSATLPSHQVFLLVAPNKFRMLSSNSVFPTSPLNNGARTYAMQLEMKTDGTLADCDPTVDPTPVCIDGCTSGACFVLNNVDLFMQVDGNPVTPDIIHYTDNGLGRNWATYQGGAGTCPGATPTKQSTWGSVKALYR